MNHTNKPNKMKLTKEQLEVIELDDSLNVAYFYSKENGISFDVEFKAESTYHKPESETGFNGEWEITFIDIIYISYGYDLNEESIGELDLVKRDLERLIQDYLVTNELEVYFEI